MSDYILVSELLIGENRGMGAVKNILAKDPLGNWMTIYTATVDGTIQVNLFFNLFFHLFLFFPLTQSGFPSHLSLFLNISTFS